MAAFTFPRIVNPRLGKRERLATDGTVKQLNRTAYEVPVSADGKMAKRTPSAAYLMVLTNAVYWSIDGTDPAAGVGFPGGVGDTIYLDSYQQIQAFKVTQQSAAGAIEAVYLFGA